MLQGISDFRCTIWKFILLGNFTIAKKAINSPFCENAYRGCEVNWQAGCRSLEKLGGIL
jgi:hypothetical protein